MYENFYPTPDHVIEKMIEGLSMTHKSVLDPSAGTGNILKFVLDNSAYYNRENKNLYAIENDPDMRAALAEKGFRVIGADFFQYPGLHYFDFIIMNPPFDNGARHLLKAWEISNGAVIRCLLNTETLVNLHTNERQQLAEIIKEFGWASVLGPVFKDAERKTQANISLVHLQDRRSREAFLSDFDPDVVPGADGFDFEDIEGKDLALSNLFQSYESGFVAVIGAFKELLVAKKKVQHYMDSLVGDYPSPDKLIGDALQTGKSQGAIYKIFLETATKAAWDNLFSKTKLGSVTTEGVRTEIESLKAGQEKMAFTASNMEDLFHILFMNREHIMLQCVLEVFDHLTKYHKENRAHYEEGWKTNAAYKVAEKFILPNIGSDYSEMVDYQAARKLADIEKALCFLSGKRYENIRSIEGVYGQKPYFGKWVESEFFLTKLFKKRTMHFKWLDKALMDEFNAMVTRERWGELPEKTKSGVYN